MKKKDPNIKREITLRVNLLYVLFLLLGGCIFGRILWLQWGPDGDALRKKATDRAFFMERIDGKRGEILSANGEMLATSILMYYLGIDFGADSLTRRRFEAGVDGLADSLSRLFGDAPRSHYKALLESGYNRDRRGYRRLNQRLISYDELQRARTFPLLRLSPGYGGISVERVYSRQHPFGRLAERTLGMTVSEHDTLVVPGSDSTARRRIQRMLTERGRYGIEYSFDDKLKGRAGWQMMQRQTESFSTPVESPFNVPTADGWSVVTTLDMDFQDVASSMLARQLVRHGAERGCVVLMEVATGDIKAIANLENMGGQCYERSNYAIAGRYEPGSTFKLASLLALLDDGMTLGSPVVVGNGKLELRGELHRDDHEPESRVLTLARIFETSSNVGFVQAVEQQFRAPDREKEYVDYLASLGFAEPLGTGMIGEATPLLHRPTPEARRKGQWHTNSASWLSYGYGLEISPLHTLALYNAVANDGKMVRPRLVRELRGVEPDDTQVFPVEVINPAIASPRTIEALQRSLSGVVEEGTARVLQNPYYKVAAKTGTAQQEGYGGGAGQHYLATMVGYFPADDPQYSCIVSIWTRFGSPQDVIYGSSLAGPVFKAVADRVYVTRWDLQPAVASLGPHSATQPAVKGGPSRDVSRVANELGIKLTGETGRRDWVATSMRADSTTVTATRTPPAAGVVPAVVGMGLRDALFALESRGLRVDFSGRGRVTGQHPEAGTTLRPGATITITLQQP